MIQSIVLSRESLVVLKTKDSRLNTITLPNNYWVLKMISMINTQRILFP